MRNLHVDANVTEAQLLAKSDGLLANFVTSFRQAAANGSFKFGIVELKDPDLNRLHSIVTEIDSRRVFYACSDDEIPKHAMTSLYKARDEIRLLARGVWANRSCERIVQAISHSLADACTRAERLKPEELTLWSPDGKKFMDVMTEMRLAVWVLVAILKQKIGSIIDPRHLPPSISLAVSRAEV